MQGLLSNQFCQIRLDSAWAKGIIYIYITKGVASSCCLDGLAFLAYYWLLIRGTLQSLLDAEALERTFGCTSVNLDELIIHTDQGSQYTGNDLKKSLVVKEITCRISGREIW